MYICVCMCMYMHVCIRTYNAFILTVCLIGRYEDTHTHTHTHTHTQHEHLSRYRHYASDKWVPVTTARHTLRLRMEERPPIWRVAAKILNKQ
jgi:hypothetical protein